jgi:hypothetical protein
MALDRRPDAAPLPGKRLPGVHAERRGEVMIYKMHDGTRVRTTHFHDDAGTIEFEHYRYTPEKETLSVTYLDGEEAQKYTDTLFVRDAIRFVEEYGCGPEKIARTGRPSRTPARIAGVLASVTTVAAMAVVLAPDAEAPEYPLLRDVVSAPVVTPTPVSPEPYRPEPREPRRMDRDGERKTLSPLPSPTVVRPSTTPATKRPIATPPADIRISFYRDCSGNPQPCIDAGTLTMYAGRILAGHNYDGYQWLSRVPVGRTVRVISGPLAGTYEVYGHHYVARQGGAIPAFPGDPALVLQTCEGRGTGFSLLRRA